MRNYLNEFYLKYIRSTDPGFFLAKYAGKAAFSCLIAFLAAFVFDLKGEMFFWWMVGAVCTVLFRTGSTLKRRKIYALMLLAIVCVTVPAASVIGQNTYLSLGFIFLLSFACFFVASAGLSASTIGNGSLIVTLIAVFSPVTGFDQGILRSICLLSGGLVSFMVNFYIWPFDPEKVIFLSARLAIEDMAFFLESVCIRLNNTENKDEEIQILGKEAIGSVRRYRSFLESFSIDPLKGVGVSHGPGLLYYSLIRMYESIVGLSNHIHFADNRPEFVQLKNELHRLAIGIFYEFRQFSRLKKKGGLESGPGFDEMNQEIDRIRSTLLIMGGYRKGDAVQEKFLDAWAAVYALKSVMIEFKGMQDLAQEQFQLGET